MDKKKEYSEQWDKSSAFFYNNNDYNWMCGLIKSYNTVLEIGCGTGYSTLALIKNGHKVIAIEKNEYCMGKAKNLILSNGYKIGDLGDDIGKCDVIFILMDVCDNNSNFIIEAIPFDIVICWNIGTYWSTTMIQNYVPKLMQYGLTLEQIKEAPESSYSEYIIWLCGRYGKTYNVPVQVVDRTIDIDYLNDYIAIKTEFNYSSIEFNSTRTFAKSKSGRVLSYNNKKIENDYVELYLLSVIFKP
ncbi:class I SAM-dependent methyltransferase [Maledivibacter halophilus]|uniref:Protein-L-isoaspartate carboxylmethyltransferase n=1 Tax=Maledivibacter halophilus TaxID=36842 RepID=A0A1T5LVU6_9FIRM|nr:class I SAM-dependent methyltransferase [Maledivibacter halophilus]SKC80005.1 Protein-L-isoaspartate carboxylmethyltransferase [Maledivibacter halophilus]